MKRILFILLAIVNCSIAIAQNDLSYVSAERFWPGRPKS